MRFVIQPAPVKNTSLRQSFPRWQTASKPGLQNWTELRIMEICLTRIRQHTFPASAHCLQIRMQRDSLSQSVSSVSKMSRSHVIENEDVSSILIFVILLHLWERIFLVSLRPPWSSVQISWLQIQGSRFDFRRYQIFWEVVGLERGSPILVSANEELLEKKK
jgi:hypothetical protein